MVAGLPLMMLLLLFCSWPPTSGRAANGSLKPHAAACSGHRVIPPHHGRWVPLYRHHGPCSPPSSTGAAKPSLDDMLRQDQLRVDHIHWSLSSESDHGAVAETSKASVKQPVGFNAAYLHNQPMIQVILGSEPKSSEEQQQGVLPGVIQTVVLDTASDVPWVQCAPCPVPPCHPQADDTYDPSKSSTYDTVKCGSDACDQLGRRYAAGCGVDGQCQYHVLFPNSKTSSSSGTYSVDLLTVGPNTSLTFHFGCTHAVAEDSAGELSDNRTAGVMALGGGPESLASQAADTYGSVFSYCIPPATDRRRLGFFVLGGSPPANVYVSTPMVRYAQAPTFYAVRLVGINVNGQRLNVTPSAFAAGAVMDSRTAVTRLPPTAYVALREAFRAAMAVYNAAPPPKGGLDTCYDFAGGAAFFVVPPRIELVFEGGGGGGGGGVPVELDPSGVLFNGCLAFIPNRDDRMLGILGNLQQQTMEVLYDVGNKAVGFRRGAC